MRLEVRLRSDWTFVDLVVSGSAREVSHTPVVCCRSPVVARKVDVCLASPLTESSFV